MSVGVRYAIEARICLPGKLSLRVKFPLTNLPVSLAMSRHGIGVSGDMGNAKVRWLSCGNWLSMPLGKLDMKNPGRMKVAGTSISRMYRSTATLKSKCSTSGYLSLVSLMRFKRKDQMRCQTSDSFGTSALIHQSWLVREDA